MPDKNTNELPTPKYKIGDTVWYGHTNSVVAMFPCPDCEGKGKWEIKSPSGNDFKMSCPRCGTSNYSLTDRLPSLKYTKFQAGATKLTIGQINSTTHTFGDDFVSYMCIETGIGGGSVYYESGLFATEVEALTAAQAIADAKNAEILEKPTAMKARHLGSLRIESALMEECYTSTWDAWYNYRNLRDSIESILEDFKDARDPNKQNGKIMLPIIEALDEGPGFELRHTWKRSTIEQALSDIRDFVCRDGSDSADAIKEKREKAIQALDTLKAPKIEPKNELEI